MRTTLLAGALLLAMPVVSGATPALTFGQVGAGDTVAAAPNAGDTATTLSAIDVPVSVTELEGGTTASALFNLDATSIGAASMSGADVVQRFSGTFSFTTGAQDLLSGTFTDAVFGAGTGLTLTASDAALGEVVSFVSSVIPAADLLSPRAISLAFSDVTPGVAIVGSTLGGFGAAVSGDLSATAAPEPGALALLGIGLFGLGLVRLAR